MSPSRLARASRGRGHRRSRALAIDGLLMIITAVVLVRAGPGLGLLALLGIPLLAMGLVVAIIERRLGHRRRAAVGVRVQDED